MTDRVQDEGKFARPRRLRHTAGIRRLAGETQLGAHQLIHPLFIREGRAIDRPIASMPGHAQVSVDNLDRSVDELAALGINSVLLFGIPAEKDHMGAGAWNPEGPVPRAIARIRELQPDMVVIADVCMCEYTSHGHCGVVSDESGCVDNDETLPLLASAAVAYAAAGADMVAPSAMMDGQVGKIRAALDTSSFQSVSIMSYAVKYASCFYGPFREAAESAPAFADRRSYQMDPRNSREALREAAMDEAEGADILMVKPAGPYLDVLKALRDSTSLPIAAYQVSGEYAMIKAAAERGWIDGKRAAIESLYGIRRAGADMIITYFARDFVRWTREEG